MRPVDGAAWCAEFLFHALNTRSFRATVHDDASGTKVRHTSPKKICNVSVRYPESIKLQQEVARRLDDLADRSSTLAGLWKQKLVWLTELKQSVLHKAFTGELTADHNAADRSLTKAGV